MTPALRERPLVRRDVLLPLVRVALTHLRALRDGAANDNGWRVRR